MKKQVLFVFLIIESLYYKAFVQKFSKHSL